jgi:hypothetical protein
MLLPVIPLATIATIALMGLFAYRNGKQAWVKHRKPIVERLHELKRDISTAPLVSEAPSVWYAGMAINPTEFSQQLGLLQTSLQRANAPVLRQTQTGEPRTTMRNADRARVAH